MNAGGVDKACKSSGRTSLGLVRPADSRGLYADVRRKNTKANLPIFLPRNSAIVLRNSAGRPSIVRYDHGERGSNT